MRATPKALATGAVALAACMGLVFAGSAGGAGGGEDGSITISFAAQKPQTEGCVSRADGLTMSKATTEDAYSFIITISSDLCSPIDAKAAAYAMPDNRSWPWPQSLIEVEEFRLSEAGITTVTFAKECDPIQFDVLTGATPQNIDPFGAHHGPLLVPHTDQWNTNGTAYQYWPLRDRCNDNTTTTTTTDNSTSTSSTTSEPPVTVEPATTVPTSVDSGGSATDDGQPGVTVGGVTASRSPAALSITG